MQMCVTFSPSRRRLTTGVAAPCWPQGAVAAAGLANGVCGPTASRWNAEPLAGVAGLIDSVSGMNGADMN